jgi:prepilin-type N-terminal cleavage/methylation domain-containing protein
MVRSTQPRRFRVRRARQEGLTLVEMVVALAILAVGVVGIVYGLSQTQAELDAAVNNASTVLASADQTTYVPCATMYNLPSVSGVTIIDTVSESDLSPGSALSRTQCSSGEWDYGIQEITISASEGGQTSRRVVWKEHRA